MKKQLIKTSSLRFSAALSALFFTAFLLAGCASHDGDIKAAHAHEDAAAQQARSDKRSR